MFPVRMRFKLNHPESYISCTKRGSRLPSSISGRTSSRMLVRIGLGPRVEGQCSGHATRLFCASASCLLFRLRLLSTPGRSGCMRGSQLWPSLTETRRPETPPRPEARDRDSETRDSSRNRRPEILPGPASRLGDLRFFQDRMAA